MSRVAAVAKRLLTQAPAALLAVAALGFVIRFTVHDRFPILAGVAYAVRPFACMVLVLLAAGTWLLQGKSRRAAITAACATIPLAAWLMTSLVFNPAPGPLPRGALRGLAWNVWHGERGWDRVSEKLREFDPDVAWITEGDGPDYTPGPNWKELVPGREVREVPDGIVLLSRFPILAAEAVDLGNGSRALKARVSTPAGPVTCVVVDLNGKVFRHRAPAIDRLVEVIDSCADGPLLVAGDFNTPRDSALFDALRQRMDHAFEKCGRGMDGTWPVVGPVLPIDHVWGRGVTFHTCHLPVTGSSDHLPVVFTWSEAGVR